MVYLYKYKKEFGKVIAVKAETQDEIRDKLSQLDKMEYLGSLTDAEMQALCTTSFGVITA